MEQNQLRIGDWRFVNFGFWNLDWGFKILDSNGVTCKSVLNSKIRNLKSKF
jgi:hypothetical protein